MTTMELNKPQTIILGKPPNYDVTIIRQNYPNHHPIQSHKTNNLSDIRNELFHNAPTAEKYDELYKFMEQLTNLSNGSKHHFFNFEIVIDKGPKNIVNKTSNDIELRLKIKSRTRDSTFLPSPQIQTQNSIILPPNVSLKSNDPIILDSPEDAAINNVAKMAGKYPTPQLKFNQSLNNSINLSNNQNVLKSYLPLTSPGPVIVNNNLINGPMNRSLSQSTPEIKLKKFNLPANSGVVLQNPPAPRIIQAPPQNIVTTTAPPPITPTVNSIIKHLPAEKDEPWHAEIYSEVRNHCVTKLLQNIYPSFNETHSQEEIGKKLIEFARRIESDAFETSQNKTQYYYKLAEQINKIQQELRQKERHDSVNSTSVDAASKSPKSDAVFMADQNDNENNTNPSRDLDMSVDTEEKLINESEILLQQLKQETLENSQDSNESSNRKLNTLAQVTMATSQLERNLQTTPNLQTPNLKNLEIISNSGDNESPNDEDSSRKRITSSGSVEKIKTANSTESHKLQRSVHSAISVNEFSEPEEDGCSKSKKIKLEAGKNAK